MNEIIESEKMREVILVPYNPNWITQFEQEAIKIRTILGENCIAIHHIGSTAIPGIYAKPVIDILVVVNDLAVVDSLNSAFGALGYECMGEYGIIGRRYYWKNKSQHTHHIHLFAQGNPEIKRHLGFRDFMRQHPDIANAYSWTKRNLAEQFPHDIVSYVNGKESFVLMMDYRAGFARNAQLNASDNIILEPYNPNWPKLAAAEINTIQKIVHLPFLKMEHMGSTAVEDLCAKPLIDIFIALDSMHTAAQWIKPLETLGYHYWADNPDPFHARYFKGMPPYGVCRTHHVHIMPMGEEFNRVMAFRNLLRNDANIRNQYAKLKYQLAQEYPTDREAYTNAKSSFITSIILDK